MLEYKLQTAHFHNRITKLEHSTIISFFARNNNQFTVAR